MYWIHSCNGDPMPTCDILFTPACSVSLPAWNNPDRTKRYFREAPGERRTHLHVRRWGSWAEQAALLLRDYLRAHPEEAQRYAALKHALAGQYSADRIGYTEAKTPSDSKAAF